MKDKKNILIGALLFAVVAMSIGYAALSQTLNINGTATIANWDVEITNIESALTGTAEDKTDPSYTRTSATFDALLQTKGDTATYTITIENKGTIDAKLSSIEFTPSAAEYGASPIIYSVESQPSANSTLAAGATTTVVIRATYDSSLTDEAIAALTETQKTKTISAVLEYVQAD